MWSHQSDASLTLWVPEVPNLFFFSPVSACAVCLCCWRWWILQIRKEKKQKLKNRPKAQVARPSISALQGHYSFLHNWIAQATASKASKLLFWRLILEEKIIVSKDHTACSGFLSILFSFLLFWKNNFKHRPGAQNKDGFRFCIRRDLSTCVSGSLVRISSFSFCAWIEVSCRASHTLVRFERSKLSKKADQKGMT